MVRLLAFWVLAFACVSEFSCGAFACVLVLSCGTFACVLDVSYGCCLWPVVRLLAFYMFYVVRLLAFLPLVCGLGIVFFPKNNPNSWAQFLILHSFVLFILVTFGL